MAGFEPVGVDIQPQKRYRYEFIQADAMEILRDRAFLEQFAFIHASPPCQCYSVTKHLSKSNHPDLVGPVRELLLATGKPYVIENVVGAPLIHPVRLCGSSFGLDLRRHRLFESNLLLRGRRCTHGWQTPRFYTTALRNGPRGGLSPVVSVSGNRTPPRKQPGRVQVVSGGGDRFEGGVYEWRRAMEIDWMNRDELAQAIPPAYTHFLGLQIASILSSPNRSPFLGARTAVTRRPLLEPEEPLWK
jgi:DNA (cytosine-5)-methyltransferase 1